MVGNIRAVALLYNQKPALTTGNFPSGTRIILINNGSIIGCGGYGGDDNNHNGTTCPTADGYQGGDAIAIGASGTTTVIVNNGTIASGGGGGGAGAELSGASACFAFYTGGSGGGGAGSAVGLGSTYNGPALKVGEIFKIAFILVS